MTHIVLLGSGFGSIYAYRRLTKLRRRYGLKLKVTIVSKINYFLFSPLLHEVATGGLRQTDAVQPIREIIDCKRDQFIQAEVSHIDTDRSLIKTRNGKSIQYDYLVVGLGSRPNFFGISGAEKNVKTLKYLSDAREIRNNCLRAMQSATEQIESGEVDPGLLNWVVVGAGPTGIELATELVEFADSFFERTPNFPRHKLNIELHDAGQEVLSNFPPAVRVIATKTLKQLGIKIVLNSRITKVTSKSVVTNNQDIASQMVMWTAGVAPVDIDINPPVLIEKGGVHVTEYLRLPNVANVFIVGDLAYLEGVPQLAQAAVKMGEYVAGVIVADLKKCKVAPFAFKNRGMLVSLGQWKSAGYVGKIILKGVVGWWIWRTVYLSKLPGMPNKIRTVIDWTIDIFYRRDLAEL